MTKDIDIIYEKYIRTTMDNTTEYNIKHKKYIGYITDDKQDPKGLARYLVYIPELYRLDKKMQPIWCPNHVTDARWTEFKDFKTQKKYTYGEYKPLFSGMKVFVEFEQNNEKSGRITQILNDYDKIVPLENNYRDYLHMIRKTKENTWMYIDERKKYLHWSFHHSKTGFTMDENKVSINVAKPIQDGMGGLIHDLTSEYAENGHFLTYKNFRFWSVDDSGIAFNVGKKNRSFIKITDNEIFFKSEGDLKFHAGNEICMYAENKLKLTSSNEIGLFAKYVKLTATQKMCLRSNILDMQAALSAHLEGKYTFVHSEKLTHVCSDDTTKICNDTPDDKCIESDLKCTPMTISTTTSDSSSGEDFEMGCGTTEFVTDFTTAVAVDGQTYSIGDTIESHFYNSTPNDLKPAGGDPYIVSYIGEGGSTNRNDGYDYRIIAHASNPTNASIFKARWGDEFCTDSYFCLITQDCKSPSGSGNRDIFINKAKDFITNGECGNVTSALNSSSSSSSETFCVVTCDDCGSNVPAPAPEDTPAPAPEDTPAPAPEDTPAPEPEPCDGCTLKVGDIMPDPTNHLYPDVSVSRIGPGIGINAHKCYWYYHQMGVGEVTGGLCENGNITDSWV